MIRTHLAILSLLTALLVSAPAHALPTPLERAAAQRLGLSQVSLQRLELGAAPERVTFALDLAGERATVRLVRASLRSPSFRLLVQDQNGIHEAPAPSPSTYQGTVDERPGSIVSGTIRDGRLRAVVALADGRRFYVEPLCGTAADTDPALHAVYPSDAVIATTPKACPSDEAPAIVPPPDAGSPYRALPNGAVPNAAAATYKVADVAFDTDVEFYQSNHSNMDSTIADIETILAGVNAVYQRDCSITHHVATILVRTTEPDPFSSFRAETLLIQLRNDWNMNRTGVNRDVVHLMTGKTLMDNVVGYASIGVICNTSRAYGLTHSHLRTYAERVTVVAHELGHNWNAQHCDTVSPCYIMCSTIGGCDGLGLPSFEPAGQTAISNFAASRTCLGTQTTDVGPEAVAANDLRLESPWPSPVRGAMSVRFYVARARVGRLDVVDLAGRRIARLADGVQAAGWHTATWDGCDARGHAVAPGALFLRLDAGDTAVTRKLMLLR